MQVQTVYTETECAMICLQLLVCTGFNYNSRVKYQNCQLTDEKWENLRINNGNEWIFYAVLINVSNNHQN